MIRANNLTHRVAARAGRFGLYGGFLLFLVVLLTGQLSAGVLVAPSVIFLSDDSRTGRMTLQNTGDLPQEVSVFFSFGLPEGDSLGDVQVILDSTVQDPQSCLGWVKAFPRRLVLPPNASQVVRFVATPPRDLPAAEYWSRVVIRSQDAQAQIPVATETEGITTKLNMVMQTAIMLKYRHGDNFTELALDGTEVTELDNQVQVMLNMKNKGNASYLGMLNTRLLDAEGKEISHNSVQLAVYRDLKRRVLLPITEGNHRRPFKVEVEITAKGRNDIAAKDMLYGNDITYTAQVD